jgi:hypothetical protein
MLKLSQVGEKLASEAYPPILFPFLHFPKISNIRVNFAKEKLESVIKKLSKPT